MKRTITINLDQILETALLGIRRGYVFIGCGFRGAAEAIPGDLFNKENMAIHFLPREPTKPEMDEIKDEFRRWIIRNSLRESIESFSIFLDKLYQALTIKQITSGEIEKSEGINNLKRFHRIGFDDKIERLRIGKIESKLSKEISSIQKARNCLSHRNSIVSEHDIYEGFSLTLYWVHLNISVLENDGLEIDFDFDSETPIRVEKGGIIKSSIKRKNRSFKPGETLTFSRKEAEEILFTILQSAVQYTKSAESMLKTPSRSAPDE